MSRTLKRLAGPGLITNAAVTKYTVPASTVAVITQIHVNNTSGSAATFTASIGADAAGTEIFTSYNIPANSSVDFFGQYIMAAAEIFQALSGTTTVLNLSLFGYEITLG
jgi:hypothetical protein